MACYTATLILTVIIVLFAIFIKRRQNYWKRRGIPQLSPNWLFGDNGPLITGKKSIAEFYTELYQKAKSMGWKHIGIYNAWSPVYLPVDLEQIKLILTKDYNYFAAHGLYHQKNDPMSMHLFNLESEEWKERRAKLTPLFTSGKMKMMFEIIAEKNKSLTELVSQSADANAPINMKQTLARFTTDIIGSCAFGIECNTLKEPKHKLNEVGKKVFQPRIINFFLESMISSELLGKFGYHTLETDVENYFTQIVKDTINYRQTSGVQRKDFIQLMLQLMNNGSLDSKNNSANKLKYPITEREVINEAFLFYLAGFETSSSTMNFAFFELAQDMEIQDRLRKEILQVLEKYDGQVTYDGLLEMDYLDRVIKETLRKYPVVTILPRRCTRNYKLLNSDTVIEAGTYVHIPVVGIQMDTRYYENPEKFNPDNFLPENKEKRPDVAWIPFGEGPRQCIGMRFGLMQTKAGIVTLLKDFKFVLDKSMKLPLHPDAFSLVYMFKEDVMLKAIRI